MTFEGYNAVFGEARNKAKHIWESAEIWTPERIVAKGFMSVIGTGLNSLSAKECVGKAQYVPESLNHRGRVGGLRYPQ